MKKLLCMLMSLTMVFCAASCRGRGDNGNGEEPIDHTKTQLYVANYDSGFGSEWLKKTIARFVEDYKDYSFEEGKTGVQVYTRFDKTFYGKSLLSSIEGSTYDVYFTEGFFYYNFVADNKLLDITDIVTQPLTKYGETKSIEDKLSPERKDFFKVNGSTYYALPHFEAVTGIIYDMDLFEEKEYYFAKNKENGNDGFTTKSSGEELAYGPDNLPDTEDDGLPATYEDFFKLCDRMKSDGIIPICWNGIATEYLTDFAKSLAADYDGKEETMLNFTFDGTADIVTGFDGNTPITEEVEINPSNGYRLAQQAGKYYALQFIDKLVSGKYYRDGSFSQGVSHTDNQSIFLRSKLDTQTPTVAMMIDGTWWENEATNSGAYDSLVKQFGPRASRDRRHFGFMPFPKATEAQLGSQWTVQELFNSAGFIKASIPQNRVEIAKTFLQYCHTQQSLAEFSVETNTMKAFNYSLDDEQNKLSNWGKQMYNLHSAAAWVTPYAQNQMYLHSAEIKWESQVDGAPYNNPARDIMDKGATVNGKKWFTGMATVNSQSYWNTFAKYFNN